MRWAGCLAFSFLAASALTFPLAAQRATLVGIVVDSLTGAPLVGASVVAVEPGLAAVADDRGQFELPGVSSGDFTILIRHAGYRPSKARFELTVTRPVRVDFGTIALAPLVFELDPVRVEAEAVSDKLRRVGFFHRMSSADGTFLTWEDIRDQDPTNTSELFRRIPGFRTSQDGSIGSRRGIPSLSSGLSRCEVNYYIDGVHTAAPNIDVVLPAAIAGVEVYSGAATIPPSFRVAGNPKCGVIAIWTRDGSMRR